MRVIILAHAVYDLENALVVSHVIRRTLPESIFSWWRSENAPSVGEAPPQSSARPTWVVWTAVEPTLAAGAPSVDTAYHIPGLGETSLSSTGCSSNDISEKIELAIAESREGWRAERSCSARFFVSSN